MATSNCNQNCGCSNSYTVTAPCPPSCTEVFNAQCIVYTGTDISCGDDTVISRYDYMDTAITKIINYFCNRLANIPITVVESNSEFLTVTPVVVGNTTTWVLDLVNLPGQQVYVVEAGGTNVTVGENTVGNTTTFTVTAQGTDVQSGDDFIDVAVTQVGDDDIVTLTLDINEVDQALGDVFVTQGSSDNVIITTLNDFPTTNDVTFQLDVVATDVQSTDPLITVTPSGGTAPDYDQLFELAMDADLLREFIMDTTSGVAPVGGIVGDTLSGIDVQYDPVSHTLTIINTAGLPNRWLTLGNGGVDADIPAGSPNDKFNIVGDAVINGISVQLASGPGANEATYTLVNEDRGSSQLIFGTIECNNGGPSTGTCTAGTNTDALTIVGGAEIGVSVPSTNTIVIDNLITAVYSNFVADNAISLQAGSTTDTLDVLGGESITTVGNNAGPGNNSITIDWDGATVGAGLSGTGTSADPILNTANVYETIAGDAGAPTTASGLTDTLNIVGSVNASGQGVETTVSSDTVTIATTFNKFESLTTLIGPSAIVPFTHNLNSFHIIVSVAANPLPTPLQMYTQGTDYSVVIDSANQITVTDLTGSGLGNVVVTVIG